MDGTKQSASQNKRMEHIVSPNLNLNAAKIIFPVYVASLHREGSGILLSMYLQRKGCESKDLARLLASALNIV
jgi:hypothetical protein